MPVVAVSSAIEYPWVGQIIGNDDNLAYVPNVYHVGSNFMNFYERVKNVITNYIAVWKFCRITEESQTESMRKYLSSDIPNIREVEKNVALTLVNRNSIIFGTKPVTPALVEIAGLHIDENNTKLPTVSAFFHKTRHDHNNYYFLTKNSHRKLAGTQKMDGRKFKRCSIFYTRINGFNRNFTCDSVERNIQLV